MRVLLAILTLPLVASPASALVTVIFDPLDAARQAEDLVIEDAHRAVGAAQQASQRAQELGGAVAPGGLASGAVQTGFGHAEGAVRAAGDAALAGVGFGAALARAVFAAGAGLPGVVVRVP